MSKHNITYNLNQRKYSLKFIIYLFILFDILLLFQATLEIFWLVVSWEVMVFFGILIGLRAQRIYKDLFFDLLAIRKNPKYNNKEDLRGFRLVRAIDHATIEHDLWMSEQEAKDHKLKNKIKKGGGKRMLWDDVVKKQAGYSLIAILALFGVVFGFILDSTDLHWILVIALSGTWEIVDIFLFFYIHYIFNIEIPAKAPMSGPVVFKENLNTAGAPGT